MEKKKMNVEIQEVEVDSVVWTRIGAGSSADAGIMSPSGPNGSISTMIGCHGSTKPPGQNPTSDSLSDFITAIGSHAGNDVIVSTALAGAGSIYLGSGGTAPIPITVAVGILAGAATSPSCHGIKN